MHERLENAASPPLELDALRGARWFAGKDATLEGVSELAALDPGGSRAQLHVLEVSAGDGSRDRYVVPAVARDGRLAEDESDEDLWRALARATAAGETLAGDGCRLSCEAGPAVPPAGALAADAPVRPLGADQSNTTLVVGERLALKCYRRLSSGVHPEIELARHLTERGYAHVPPVYGSATLELDGGECGLLLLQEYVVGARDGWAHAEAELGSLLDAGDPAAAPAATAAWAPAAGRAIAGLHATLAGAVEPALAARRATADEVDGWRTAALRQLAGAVEGIPEPARADLRAAEPRLRALVDGFVAADAPLVCRIHGDLHIGQLLQRPDGDLAIVDFEGEPTKPVAERRAHATPLRDLASILRSLDLAARWVALERERAAAPAPPDVVDAWIRAARRDLAGAYAEALAGSGAPFGVDDHLVAALEAEKAVYELVYAARFLPSWLEVARRSLRAFTEEK